MHTNRRRKRARNAGLSLVELMIAMGLTGVILVPASSLLLQSYGNAAAYTQQNSAQQNARHAVDLVADDMKGALAVTTLVTVGSTQATLPTNTVMGVSPSGTNANVVYTAPVYFNISDDNGNTNRVSYWLEGTNLRRQIISYVDDTTTPGIPPSATAGVVMAQNVQKFTAEQQPILVVGSLPNYNVVRLTITSSLTSETGSSAVTITADATLRNNLISGNS